MGVQLLWLVESGRSIFKRTTQQVQLVTCRSLQKRAEKSAQEPSRVRIGEKWLQSAMLGRQNRLPDDRGCHLAARHSQRTCILGYTRSSRCCFLLQSLREKAGDLERIATAQIVARDGEAGNGCRRSLARTIRGGVLLATA